MREEEMKSKVRIVLKCFYGALAISALLGITVALPYAARAELVADNWQWWYVSIGIWSYIGLFFGVVKLHCWAFPKKGS